MKKSILCIFIIFSVISIALAQESNLKEISKIDITTFKKIKSDEVSVFGLHLGMDPDEVHYILMKNKNLDYQVDKMHGTTDIRIYVYDKDETGNNKNCILYLIWENRKTELSTITLFEDFAPYLIGNSSYLLANEFSDKNAEIINKFLRKPDRSEITLNIPSIQTKHITNSYDSRGFKITLKKNSEKISAVFALFIIE